MFNIGGGELIVIMLIALIVLGPKRLPDAARQIGKVMGDLRRLSTGFQNEVRSAIDTADDPTRIAARRNVLAKEEPVAATDSSHPVRTEPLVAGPPMEPRAVPAAAAKSTPRKANAAKKPAATNGTPVQKKPAKAGAKKKTAKAAPRRTKG